MSTPPPAADSPAPVLLATIDASLLEVVEDNTTFRDDEAAAWFHLLEVARDMSDKQLEAVSAGELAYAQLINQPSFYRGRVVHIDGNARRVEAITPAENHAGIEQLYRIIVQPGRDVLRPFTLYCLELPSGWAPGDQLPNNGHMTANALFFKNWVYNHQQGVDLSPVFLSRSVTPIATIAREEDSGTTLPAWQLVGLAALSAGAIVAWIALRGDGTPRPYPATAASEIADELRSLDLLQQEEE